MYEGGLKVQGLLKGEARVTADIAIERGATVEARLDGENVSVRGRVTGDVSARGRLLIAGGASLSGDVNVARIVVEDGATFNGRVTMGNLPEMAEAEAAEAEPVVAEEAAEP